ncbi:hypothetical protein [Microbacterium sp. CFBP9034]|uniref:hypothetical protein n=1 Tax=Microbacterium sp. CFBP9034 TaxID=3096540 RepID=UPI002A6B4210|nr:hypothetical protein [Microbacterium sp. CFBP9034]MDY0908803.1 hypothetical protein [Microbacterium sp. CFBP9034]
MPDCDFSKHRDLPGAGPRRRARGTANLGTSPALVSFTPAFSLLTRAHALVGVADLLRGDAAAGTALAATLSTMVAIALGVLAGSSLSNRMRRPAL